MSNLQSGPSIPPKRKGLPRLIAAARYSLDGLRSAFASEEAFRLEVLVFVIFTPIALWLGETAVERVLLISSLLLLLIVELLNTAVEALVNRISPEYHDLSRKAKDIGSAAVFLAMLLVAVVWGMLLL
ncbi:MAG: diacylglycerol kinase [Gammaproteobacteria bacterium]|nr:diacylglycerol kinase [Gammaproteobacteria bacterium]MDP2142426.1 diacylglycerol kinase [Gammaproteobacteria bacterium]MDP2348667.1 diacylglycerol kinase [Gammaproteobacteria bacterium]